MTEPPYTVAIIGKEVGEIDDGEIIDWLVAETTGYYRFAWLYAEDGTLSGLEASFLDYNDALFFKLKFQ